MTQRDDVAVVDLHGSSESEERQSGIRAIGSVSFADDPSHDPCHDEGSVSANSETAETNAAETLAASDDSVEEPAAAPSEAGRVERPTLMGLAPIELEGGSEAAEDDSQLSAADEEDAADDADDAQEEEPELSAEASDAAHPAEVDEDDEDDAPHRAPNVATWVGPAPSDPASHRSERALSSLPEDENDPEWLDLSTRWLIATGPHAEQDVSEDSEVTNEMHWADHLAAGVRLRAESQSSAPPPPTAAVPPRHAPVYSRLAEAPPARAWAGAAPATRHQTLAGISPLPEDRASWPPPADPFASDGLRGAKPSGEHKPWDDEPSYKERPRHHTPRQSWAPLPHAPVAAAPAPTLPPWAAMSMYAPPPTAAVPPYAMGWNAAQMAPPPWAAAPGYGSALPHPQFYATGAYPSVERRPSQTGEYTAPRRATGSTPSDRAQRREHTQHQGGEVTLEQWKNLANSWMGAVGKLAIAALALHYSGLAVPLLGQFGYTPAAAAPGAPSGTQASAVGEPIAAGLAASVIADPTRSPPPANAQRGDREADTGSADNAALSSSHLRRSGSKREVGEGATRRRSWRSSHSHKAASARAATPAPAQEPDGQQDAPEAEEAQQPEQPAAPSRTPARTTEQLMAAAIGADDAAGEAFLRINSRPWSQVYIDGTLVGTTPKIDLRVSAGPHRVRLVNPELGLSKTFQVEAPAGETVSHVEHLDE